LLVFSLLYSKTIHSTRMKSNWLRGGTAPKIAKSGVVKGALTSAQRVRNILADRIKRERRANAAEILAAQRQEIAAAKETRQRIKLERAAVDQAVKQSIVEFPDAKMKIKRDKNGVPFIQRRQKGKFLPSVKVAAGFTLAEVVIVIGVLLLNVVFFGTIIWVAAHFIMKFW
jgi:hypothetical protein